MKKYVVGLLLGSAFLTSCTSNSSEIIVSTNAHTNNQLIASYNEALNTQNFVNNTQELSYIINNEVESLSNPMVDKNSTLIQDPNDIEVLVNKGYQLPEDYRPDDLVVPDIRFSFDEYDDKMLMREEAALAIEKLFNDAEREGLYLFGVSGFRSYQRQKSIYEWNLQTRGEEYTNQYSAKPGHSEHQTGLVMDITCQSVGFALTDALGHTPEGQWVAANAYKYGFVISYPEDKTHITGYSYEPWHIRYVGNELAEYLTENDMTLDEYYFTNGLTP
ncbi:D-alanyl-D-alanine carboxypeptidase [Natranaerovirga hydrolytica]|uniref:D-alanyl-D-alanine carboxypeptidase n=1 Tax=Natranaerovirga hydrolytica TaxID=680378 RepID=A0A4R1MTQ6_9FIRM|nr:M15 family metallopeptidase [Natranaerovirga hydrolytica]TCK93353.1 D-alanyl-D-alanine carboxypeptidase [Natranaerovirga hydrolytica]